MSRKSVEEDSDMSESASEPENHTDDDDAEQSVEESESSTDDDLHSAEHLSEESESGYSSRSSYDGTSSNKSESDSSNEQIIQVVNVQMSPGKVILTPLPSSPSENSDNELNKSGIDSLLSTEDDNEENEIVFDIESPPGDDDALFGMQAWQQPNEHLELELMEACRKLQDFDDTETHDHNKERSPMEQYTDETECTRNNLPNSNTTAASSSEDPGELANCDIKTMDSQNEVVEQTHLYAEKPAPRDSDHTTKPQGLWKSIWSKKTNVNQNQSNPVEDIAVVKVGDPSDGKVCEQDTIGISSDHNFSISTKGAAVSLAGVQNSSGHTMPSDDQFGNNQHDNGKPCRLMENSILAADGEAKQADLSMAEPPKEVVRAKGLITGSFDVPSGKEMTENLKHAERNPIDEDEEQGHRVLFQSGGNDEKSRLATLLTALRWKPRGGNDKTASLENGSGPRLNDYASIPQNETPPSKILASDDENEHRRHNQSSSDDEYKLWTDVGRTVSSDEESPERTTEGVAGQSESGIREYTSRKMNSKTPRGRQRRGYFLRTTKNETPRGNRHLSEGSSSDDCARDSQKPMIDDVLNPSVSMQRLCVMLSLLAIFVIASSIGTSYIGTKLALRGQMLSSSNDKPLSAATSPAAQNPSHVTTDSSAIPATGHTDAPTPTSKYPLDTGSTTPTSDTKTLSPSVTVTNAVSSVPMNPSLPSQFGCPSGEALFQFEILFDSEPSEVGILLRDSGTLGAGIWVFDPSSFRSFTQFQRKNILSICLSTANSYVFEITDTTGNGLVSVVGGTSNVYGYWRLTFGSIVFAEYNGLCNSSASNATIVECGAYCICSFAVSSALTTGGCDTLCPST